MTNTAQHSSIDKFPVPSKNKAIKRLKKRLLLVLVMLTAAALSALIIQGCCCLFADKSSPFAEILPKNTPFAAEGSPEQIKYFLNEHCGAEINILKDISPESQEKGRVLIAFLPYKHNISKKCQSYINQEACRIENTWSEKSEYPSFKEIAQCPDGGSVSYTADSESFTITCRSSSHLTVYNSASGFSKETVKESPLFSVTSSLKDPDSKDFYKLEDDRLASLKGSSQAAKQIKNTDISRILRQSDIKIGKTAHEEFSYYQKTIDSHGQRSEQLDRVNKPLSNSTIFDPLSLDEPLIIAVYNIKEPIKGFEKHEKLKNMQIWSSDPAAAKSLILPEDAEYLSFKSPQETDLQIYGKSDIFDKLFPQLGLSLPSECTINMQRNPESSSQNSEYAGFISMSDKYESTYEELQESEDAQKFIKNVKPAPSVICSNTKLSDLVIDDRADWTMTCKASPSMLAAAFDTLNVPSIFQLKVKLVQTISGRYGIDAAAAFANPEDAEEWYRNSPWHNDPKDSKYCSTEIDKNKIHIDTKNVPEIEAVPSIPSGPGTNLACGWITLKGRKKSKVCSFAAGTEPKTEEQTENRIWFKINCRDL